MVKSRLVVMDILSGQLLIHFESRADKICQWIKYGVGVEKMERQG